MIKHADDIVYSEVRRILNVDSDLCLRRFLNEEGYMTVASVRKELIEGYETPEDEAQYFADRWVREPRNEIHIDPFEVYDEKSEWN